MAESSIYKFISINQLLIVLQAMQVEEEEIDTSRVDLSASVTVEAFSKLEVPRTAVTLKRVLGEGEYGRVCLASLDIGSSSRLAACMIGLAPLERFQLICTIFQMRAKRPSTATRLLWPSRRQRRACQVRPCPDCICNGIKRVWINRD